MLQEGQAAWGVNLFPGLQGEPGNEAGPSLTSFLGLWGELGNEAGPFLITGA